MRFLHIGMSQEKNLDIMIDYLQQEKKSDRAFVMMCCFAGEYLTDPEDWLSTCFDFVCRLHPDTLFKITMCSLQTHSESIRLLYAIVTKIGLPKLQWKLLISMLCSTRIGMDNPHKMDLLCWIVNHGLCVQHVNVEQLVNDMLTGANSYDFDHPILTRMVLQHLNMPIVLTPEAVTSLNYNDDIVQILLSGNYGEKLHVPIIVDELIMPLQNIHGVRNMLKLIRKGVPRMLCRLLESKTLPFSSMVTIMNEVVAANDPWVLENTNMHIFALFKELPSTGYCVGIMYKRTCICVHGINRGINTFIASTNETVTQTLNACFRHQKYSLAKLVSTHFTFSVNELTPPTPLMLNLIGIGVHATSTQIRETLRRDDRIHSEMEPSRLWKMVMDLQIAVHNQSMLPHFLCKGLRFRPTEYEWLMDKLSNLPSCEVDWVNGTFLMKTYATSVKTFVNFLLTDAICNVYVTTMKTMESNINADCWKIVYGYLGVPCLAVLRGDIPHDVTRKRKHDCNSL